MSIIKTHKENEPIAQECVICHGTTTIWISGSAFIVANNIEHRVYYHKTCFNDQTKQIVVEALYKKAGLIYGEK